MPSITNLWTRAYLHDDIAQARKARSIIEGIKKIFDFPIKKSPQASQYAELIGKIELKPLWQSPQPQDTFEQRLWSSRAALLDLLVYDKTGDEYADD